MTLTPNMYGVRVARDKLIHADLHGAARIAPPDLQVRPERADLTQHKDAPLGAAADGSGSSLEKTEATMHEASGIS